MANSGINLESEYIPGVRNLAGTIFSPITESSPPKEFALHQNYPNPFNPLTVIRYSLPVKSLVTLKIYNILGQEMNTLIDEIQDAGYKLVRWDASDFPSGVYIYRISAEAEGISFRDVKKVLLMK